MTAARSSTAEAAAPGSRSRRAAIVTSVLLAAAAPASPQTLRFDFGPGDVAAGHVQVLATTLYSPERGHGFDLGTTAACADRGGSDALRRDVCWSGRPFFFSVSVPEGNYRVTLTLGDPSVAASTTVKAESRRLLLARVTTAAGAFETRQFTVNVRNSQVPGVGDVRLNPREQGVLHWDDKLTLEFNGSRPAVAALELARVDDAVTVFLAGDSTVTDQTREPWAAWGQMLPCFFGPGVAVANHAESGESLLAFRNQNRFAKIFSRMKAGDYLFVQFAHNDQKPGPNHLEPFTTYKQELLRVVEEARARAATPVLVTPMPRRRFDERGAVVDTHGDYPEAVRQAAKEARVALVDLQAAGRVLYEALGPERSKKAFVHFPAGSFPGQESELKDDTHFSAYGACQLARVVVEGIRANALGIAKDLLAVPTYDPARPDPPEEWELPASPQVIDAKE